MLLFFFFLFLSAVAAQTTCPPGFFGPHCTGQCTGCATRTINGISYQDCADGPDGSGACLQCPHPATQFGPSCQDCWTGQVTIGGPVLDFCSHQYPGTVCGSSVTQTTLCQCPNPTETFLELLSPDILSGSNVAIVPMSFPIQDYCCLSSCPAGTYGCSCQFKCGTGCSCDYVPPLFDCNFGSCFPTVVCTECVPEMYSIFQGDLKTWQDAIFNDHEIADSNRICVPCAAGCRVCNPVVDVNCTSAHACADTTGLCLNQCLPGWFGARCDQQCSCSIFGTVCDDGKTGSGNCSCSDPRMIVSELYGICILPSCGTDRVNLCNNHGLCKQSYDASGYSELCMCDRGWNGTQCNLVYEGYNECDCGIVWNQEYQAQLGLLPGIVLLQDMPGISLFGSTGIIPVGSAEQAQWLCSQDFFCDLFLLWSSPFYGALTGQADVFPGPVLLAAFAQLSPGATVKPSALPIGVTFQVYEIDRIKYNNCSSPTLDLNYYYFNNQTNAKVIIQYCQDTQQNLLQGTDQPCLYDPNVFPPTIPYYWVYRHWRYAGHLARLNPNSLCQMNPVVFDPASYCSTSRCLSLSGTGPPCVYQGQVTGYCVSNPNNPTGFQCSCLQFFEAGDTRTATLNSQPFFMGEACQFPVVAFCELNSNLLCNGVVGACQSKREWNGTFYLENFQQFEQALYQDYVPYCNCEGSSYTGPYCQEPLCVNNCHTQQAHGVCVRTSNGTHVCSCADGWLGSDCSIDASICLHNQVNCAGRGSCLLDINGNPYCLCNEGFLSAQCQDFYCDVSLMTPGHGTCIDNIPQGCYSPYVGPICAVDSCARYGGVVTGNPPNGCNCSLPYANLLNNKVVPACWPQCPKFNNATCGILGAGICVQTETTPDFTRTAICQCNTGFIYNTSTGLCDAFCLHGNVPAGWTQQNQLACICDPSTGFDTNNGLNPRCDNPVCHQLGTWTGSHCDCIPPFQNFTNCVTNTCNRGGSVIPWSNGASSYRCSCPLPYAPLDSNQPYDCSSTVCGNGQPNPSFTDPKNACFCQGKFRTICNATACDYCAGSFCKNNGFPNPSNINLCSCLFPFSGDNCELNQCVNGLASATIFACICNTGWTGKLCSDPACVQGSLVNNSCVCKSGYTGQQCDSALQNIATIDPVTQIITPAGSIIVPGPAAALTKTQATAVLATSAIIAAGSIGMILFLIYTQFKSLLLAKAVQHEMTPLVTRAA